MTSPSTRSRRHLPALDGLRGAAVLLVLFFHVAGGARSANPVLRAIGLINKAGWIGVTLFFVLSGFLITGILWESYGDPHWARNFYMRRVLRIFPLYYGSLLLVLLAAGLVGRFLPALHGIWIPALFLQNIPHARNISENLPSPLPLYHFWSLAVEEQFYLVWPFLLMLQKTRRQALMLCLVVIGCSLAFRVYLALFTGSLQIFDESLFSRAAELALGGALAILYRSNQWSRIVRFAPATFWVAFLIFVLANLQEVLHGSSETGRQLIQIPFISLAFAALLVLAVSPGIVQRALSVGWLRWIGTISYGTYIFHVLFLPLFSAVAGFLTHASTGSLYLVMRMAIAIAGSVLLAWLSFHFYERPFLGLKRLFPSHVAVEGAVSEPSANP